MSLNRLHSWYRQATPAQLADGRNWYPQARLACLALAERTGYDDLRTVCAVVAALSPNSRWEQNLADAEMLLDAVGDTPDGLSVFYELKVTTYNANKLKAWSIAETGDISYLRGPKVLAFYYNLLGDDGALTLDSHAYNAFVGHRAVGAKRKKINKSQRAQATFAFHRVAQYYDETPAAFQAVVWLVWKARIDAGKVEGYK